MCGIAGIYGYRESAPAVDEGSLLRVRDAMLARGPDGAGLWLSQDRRVGLAHRRLAIIDLSDAGLQPMATEDGTLRITFNGEIYNYRELRSELERNGARFRSSSDTEVLLHLYRQRGADMVHALRGMFAFAIWDDERKGLFLARDSFGIKPLYFADDGATFRFCSQVKALLKDGNVDTTPDAAGHAGFFQWGFVPDPYTLYRGVRALPAGTSFWVGRDIGRRQSTYFSIREEFSQASESPFSGSESAAHEQISMALRDSVARHLVADVRVGMFLSSGLDSGNIAGFAARVVPGRLHTICLGFEEYRNTVDDETPLAAAVARGFDAHHETRFITLDDFRTSRDHLLASMDQPSIDGVNTYFVSKVAAQSGLKVALSGLGGDELFGSYPSFGDVPRLARGLRFATRARPLARMLRVAAAPILKRVTSPKYAGLLEYGGTYGGGYLLRRGLFMPWELAATMGKAWAEEGLAELRTLERLEQTTAGISSDRARVSALELEWYMRCQLLRDADWAGMAHSLEIRVPFVDVDVFRAMAPILCSGTNFTKQGIARKFGEDMPRQAIVRGKTGFQVPVRNWLGIYDRHGQADRGLRDWAKIVNAEASVIAARQRFRKVRRVLIYRLGSLGDTVVALPCFHLIARVFPSAERKVLTNFPVKSLAAPLEAILGSSGLVDGYIKYPVGMRQLVEILRLRREIRAWHPEVLIYLSAYRGIYSFIRDKLFFRLCGIRDVIGTPYLPDRLRNRWDLLNLMYERESAVLARTLREIGSINLSEQKNWDLHLTPSEIEGALSHIAHLARDKKFIACSIGTKVACNDWGDENWRALVSSLSSLYPDIPLIMIGATEDFERSQRILSSWSNGGANLCGRLTPRESAAILDHAHMFLGHDSGPMHLAASRGTPCVAVFSARNKPGVWFPHGANHKILYHKTDCFNCGLEICVREKMKCIKSISVDEVIGAVTSALPRYQANAYGGATGETNVVS